MDSLPEDILYQILIVIKRASITHLRRCILVNKAWYYTGLPLLYRNLALSSRYLALFLEGFRWEDHAHLVRSLTVHVSAPPRMRYSSGAQMCNARDQRDLEMAMLSEKLGGLVNLASFSLHAPFREVASVTRRAVIALLENLPSSCTCLEIDTADSDDRLQGESLHVCESLRAVLPRMRFARIRTSAMCCAMFGNGPDPNRDPGTEDDGQASFRPIALPHMESLLVNCITTDCYALPRCQHPAWDDGLLDPGSPDACWPSVTAALQILTDTKGAVKPDASITVMGYTLPGDPTTWPYGRPISARTISPSPGSCASRARGTLGSSDAIEPVAEDHNWVAVYGGSRLPRPVVAAEMRGERSIAMGCLVKPAYLKSAAKWLQENPGQIPTHWLNENQCGLKLFTAEKREGEEYLSLEPIREWTPAGWIRGSHNMFMRRRMVR
ncbi:unnamed protein product [Parascedosporium putredinis]|uniref:F-box domain-containing protein n=1 Tax=Parascedosporium putredinis TaxID=1442378 RepID=A0A9P1MGN5_9PEZI|nr:unnamed protein product [Parascedosporium putredinis]CAI8004808.1 unnamed protein product [Parascedosporium putredinis]